jgi:serine/threonine protein kinase/Tol biopolymer transport system component
MNGERWQQIERLFHEALALQARDRAAFLAENCAGNDELGREVEALIAFHLSPENFIEKDASDLAAEMLADGSAGIVEGQTVGPYKILELLGAGGMGQVFRATDTRLHRTVTIKILPGNVSDPERKRRFLQEARAASALNHPNIVTVYDIANDGDMDYLVMEYVEGKSLDKFITAKRLPLADAIGYGAQIAGALAAAHSAGIVHRDIKPANVIVTPQSQVKVLDFGLAKLMEREKSEETETVEGAIMGTPAYMSPEQASGRQVDHRTDIFSLGVMLYEMIAGTRPFSGKSHVDTMHKIIHAPAPPLGKVPRRLADILDKALAKDLTARYENAGDLAADLRRFLSKTDSRALAVPASGHASRARWIVAALVMVVVGVAAWLAIRPGAALKFADTEFKQPAGSPSDKISPPPSPDGAQSVRPEGAFYLAHARFVTLTNSPGDEITPALSPDAKLAVFLADRDGTQRVWLMQVDTRESWVIGSRQATSLGSNRHVGFTGDGQVWFQGRPGPAPFLVMPLLGGVGKPLLGDKVSIAHWSPDGKRVVYFTVEDGNPMFVADRDGSNPRRIYIAPGRKNHFPTFSPDGLWIYFVNGPEPASNMDLWRIRADGLGQPERLTTFERYMAFPTPIDERTVLYIGADKDGSGPWLWEFDVEGGGARRATIGTQRFNSLSAAPSRRRLIASTVNPVANLWSVPILDGRIAEERDAKQYSVPAARALMPRFGGNSLFYVSSKGGSDGLWRLDDGKPTLIWEDSELALQDPPAISRDGSQAVVVLRRNGKQSLLWVKAVGSETRPLAGTLEVRGSPTFSPDGGWIAVGGTDRNGDGLFKVPVDGGPPQRLASGFATKPVWSPDDRFIAYVGPDESSQQKLHMVRALDGSPVPLPDSPSIRLGAGGERLQFTRDGKHLIFMQGGQSFQNFWRLDLTTLKTEQLTNLDRSATMRTFDLTPDGRIVFDRVLNNSDILLINLPDLPK